MSYFQNEVRIGSFGGPTSATPDWGYGIVSQRVNVVNGGAAGTTNNTFYLPNCEIIDIIWDTEVAWTAATSATVSVGTTGSPTLFASGIDAKGGVRVRPTFTLAQNIQNKAVAAGTYTVQVVQVGTGSAGNGNCKILYCPKKP